MKFLLGDRICDRCNGYGVLVENHPLYRIRFRFPNDSWTFLDLEFDGEDFPYATFDYFRDLNKGLEMELIMPDETIYD